MTSATLAPAASAVPSVVRVPSRLDFRVVGDFKVRMEAAISGAQGSEVVVDLADTSYLDSSALGMLLVMRDKARARGKSIVISGPGGLVREALERARFEKIFDFR